MRISKLKENAIIPTIGSEYAAGYDLYSTETITIEPGTTEKIDSGIAMEIPNGYFGAVFARSGLATKQGLRPANCVGVIDSDYRGSLIVALHNDSSTARTINVGDRIAQIVFLPYATVDFTEVPYDTLTETNRGQGGFGSTGTN